ncbi:hypothetical protein LSCM4_00216 [Leishmania orientalis]|uniref:Uncharacterized protein n=1 Tax=Leishmania orientalis TaxID=2249476 RepID=A0A836GGD6_9TRYP|nr:hypothetical protein LSCM4_00216 [Leishmania orientalis]
MAFPSNSHFLPMISSLTSSLIPDGEKKAILLLRAAPLVVVVVDDEGALEYDDAAPASSDSSHGTVLLVPVCAFTLCAFLYLFSRFTHALPTN